MFNENFRNLVVSASAQFFPITPCRQVIHILSCDYTVQELILVRTELLRVVRLCHWKNKMQINITQRVCW